MTESWKKNIVLFLGSQTISLFGSALVQYAITWYIALTTKSGAMMTLSLICGFLPTFLLSPFGGVWADRYDRKTLIVLSDALIAVATLVLAILMLIGYDGLWLLFIASAIRSFGGGIQSPAVGAILPDIVPTDKLTKVTATNASINSFVALLAPMAAGALLTRASIEAIFFIDVVTAAIAIFILLAFLRVRVHEKARQARSVSYLSDLRQGFAYISKHAYLKVFFIFSGLFFVLIAPCAFLRRLQVVRTFGGDVWRLTAIEIAFAVGIMLGGALMAAWGGLRNKIHTMALSSSAIGLFTLGLGLVPSFWVYLVFVALVGAALPIRNTPAAVLLQQKVDREYMGRVFGVFGMISSSMMPLGMLVFGPLGDVIRIEWLLIGTGILMFVQGFFLLGARVLVRAGEPVSVATGSSATAS